MNELKFFEYSASTHPKKLVILLHGYGSNGENLLNLAFEFADKIDARFISPNAPTDWEGGAFNSYQWFSIGSGIEHQIPPKTAEEIKNANKILTDFIHQQLTRFKLKLKDLFLVGFSQGAMMAIYQGLSLEEKIAGVIAYSGKVIRPEAVGEKTLSKPPICLIHGTNDTVVSFNNFVDAKEILHQQGIPYFAHPLAGLDHVISPEGIRLGKEFITDKESDDSLIKKIWKA